MAVGIILLGIVGFLPFHALEALGVPDAAIVAAHAAVALALAARARLERPLPRAPRELAVIPIVLALWHVGVIAALWRLSGLPGGPLKLCVAAAASASCFRFLSSEAKRARRCLPGATPADRVTTLQPPLASALGKTRLKSAGTTRASQRQYARVRKRG